MQRWHAPQPGKQRGPQRQLEEQGAGSAQTSITRFMGACFSSSEKESINTEEREKVKRKTEVLD